MSELVRRLYNRVDRALDRRALRRTLRHDELIDELIDGPTDDRSDEPGPLTARRAIRPALRWAKSVDPRARCHSISAGHEDLRHDGSARAWVFLFDLPGRRATAVVEVGLVWNEAADDWAGARLQAAATPVLRPDSALETMVREGKILYAAACAQSAREMESRRALPEDFRDSPEACAELSEQGLDLTEVEASLTVAWRAGIPLWVASDRSGREFVVPFRP